MAKLILVKSKEEIKTRTTILYDLSKELIKLGHSIQVIDYKVGIIEFIILHSKLPFQGD
jgi:hypothetical protein